MQWPCEIGIEAKGGSMKKAAIFDMDGLMFDTERIWKDSWNTIVPKYGYEPAPAFPKEVCGTSGEHMLEVIRKHYPGIDAVAYRADVRAAVAAATKDSVPEKEGLHEIVDFFRANGVKIAVASSSQQSKIEHLLKLAGLYDKFDFIISGEKLTRGKPAPDIFLMAASNIGVDPKDCYVLEDGMNGLRAGIAAGCATIMVIDLTEPNDFVRENCVGIYNSLLEVRDAISAGNI